MEKMSGGGLRKGQKPHGVWERLTAHGKRPCSASGHTWETHRLCYLQAFTYVATYHSTTGLSLVTSPSCPPLLSRYLHVRPAFPGRPSPVPVLNTAFLPPESISDQAFAAFWSLLP